MYQALYLFLFIQLGIVVLQSGFLLGMNYRMQYTYSHELTFSSAIIDALAFVGKLYPKHCYSILNSNLNSRSDISLVQPF